MSEQIRQAGQKALGVIEYLGLFVIGVMTLFAAGEELRHIIEKMSVTLENILLMFIYLEVFAMIGIYLRSHRLPVRMPIYIAIVALARYLILDMEHMEDWRMLAVATAVLVLMITVLIHRFGHVRFPYADSEERGGGESK